MKNSLLTKVLFFILFYEVHAQSNCLDFDGLNDAVYVNHSKILNLSTSGTIEAWINVDVINPSSGIIHKGELSNYTDEEYSLQFYWSSGQYNKICFILGNSSGKEGITWNKLVSKTSLDTGKWYHLAAVWDANYMYLYINGSLDNFMTNSVFPTANTGGLIIGANCFNRNTVVYPFDGKIDEVRIWNITRTETEIRENMYKQLNGTENGLVANYQFEDGSGTTLTNNAPSSIEEIELNSQGGEVTTIPKIIISGGGGSGGEAVAAMKISSFQIYSGGAFYNINDIISPDESNYIEQGEFLVTSVSGSFFKTGQILSASIINPGLYLNIPKNPENMIGGSGSGASFTLYWMIDSVILINGGSGYTSEPTISFDPSGPKAKAILSNINGNLLNGPSWTNSNAPLAHQWIGSVSTDWNDEYNWFGSWLPTKNIPVSLNATKDQKCIISTNVECNSLNIEEGMNLIIYPGSTLRAYGSTSISGVMTFESDNSCRTGNFIDNGQILSVGQQGSDIIFKKYLSKNKWHYNSTPIRNASSNIFWGMALYYYYEPDGVYGSIAWKKVEKNTALNSAMGYDAYIKDKDIVIQYSGFLHTGTFTINSLTRQFDGYNLIGNPYPSAIDWDAQEGWTKTNLDNAIYIWDPNLNGGQGNYMSYVNGVGTNGGSRYIPATQAFWVKVSSGSQTGSITMTNNVRVVQDEKYRASEIADDYFRIICKSGLYSDETIIRFNDNATENFDAKFDADKFFAPFGQGSMIYTKCAETPLSINSLPVPYHSLSVKLYTKVLSENQHEISLNTENFCFQDEIYLEDMLTGIITDLKKESYHYYAKFSDPENRFILHIGKVQTISHDQNVSGIEYISDPNTSKVYSIENHDVIINLPENLKVCFYELNGKLLFETTTNGKITKYHINSASSVIIAKILSEKSIFTQKLILK